MAKTPEERKQAHEAAAAKILTTDQESDAWSEAFRSTLAGDDVVRKHEVYPNYLKERLEYADAVIAALRERGLV